MIQKPPLTAILASPRGFCAGVDRAIQIVERALEKFGPPVYVRHQIVHNRYVVEALENAGAVFVEEVAQVPDGVPVIFSAHGVPKSVPVEAERRGLFHVDATCPLVGKVHSEALRHHREGRQVILIGHAGHPEVVGTMGQLPPDAMLLVEDAAQAEAVQPDRVGGLAYATQTTLSIDDAEEIIAILRRRFPDIRGPRKEDICYATTNRQQAVKVLARKSDAVMVIGSPTSSNSRRLVEVARRAGCAKAQLVERAPAIDWQWLEGVETLGITAGASAPEMLIEEVIEAIRDRYDLRLELAMVTEETIAFKLPASLDD